MDFQIEFLSFYVIKVDSDGGNSSKQMKHFQTLDEEKYLENELKGFLDGELMKIVKRKVERNPKSEQVPTKIGRFVVEDGHDLTSNPNYNMFNKIRIAEAIDGFKEASETLVRHYLDTSAIRGGVFIVTRAKFTKYFDEPFVFLLKCDFEPKVASITDEKTLINHVEMAISTKNMKSVQYPYMPEEGILEEYELKIHQASHARYFEDFLKFVEYERSMPEIVKTHVIEMAQQHLAQTFEENSEVRLKEEEYMEAWANTPKRELQEKWSTEQVKEVSHLLIEQVPDLELKFKLDHISIKALLSDFGDNIHISKVKDKFVLLVEGDLFSFEKGFSPVEFLKPEQLQNVIKKIVAKEDLEE